MDLDLAPGTLLLISTVLSFYGTIFAAPADSDSSTEEALVLTPECEPVTRFRQCWNNHYDLPSCGNEKSLTVTCAERTGRTMAKCDQDPVVKYSGALIKTFRASDKVLCDNRELYEVFKNDGYCWHAARNCAKSMLFFKTHVYSCDVVRQNHRECLEDVSQHCIKKVQQYTKALLEAHPCSGGALAPPAALLLFVTLITQLARLVA